MPTVVTDTIGATGRDYSTLSSWEAATDNDHVSADEVRVGEMYDDADFGTITAAGSTVDATRFRRLTVGTGEGYNVAADTGVWMSQTGSFPYPLTISEQYFEVLGPIGVFHNHTSGRTVHVESAGDDCTFTAVYVEATGSGGAPGWFVQGENADLRSCLARNAGATAGPLYRFDAGGGVIYNSIADGQDTSVQGFEQDGGSNTLTCHNCYAFANDTDYGGGSGTVTSTDNCASEDATAGDTGLRNLDPATELEDYVNSDYRLASGSTLEDAGTDLSGTFTESIEEGVDHGDASGSWNVGPYDGVVGGASTIDLAASVSTGSAASAVLGLAVDLDSASSAGSIPAADLGFAIGIASAVSTGSTPAADLSRAIDIQAAVATGSTPATDIALPVDLQAAVATGSSPAAVLGLATDIVAPATTGSTLAAAVALAVDLEAAVATSSVLTATESPAIDIAAGIDTDSTVAAILQTDQAYADLVAAVSTGSTPATDLSLAVGLGAGASTGSTPAADLGLAVEFAAAVSTDSAPAAGLELLVNLAAPASTSSTTGAVLTLPFLSIAADISTGSTVAGEVSVGLPVGPGGDEVAFLIPYPFGAPAPERTLPVVSIDRAAVEHTIDVTSIDRPVVTFDLGNTPPPPYFQFASFNALVPQAPWTGHPIRIVRRPVVGGTQFQVTIPIELAAIIGNSGNPTPQTNDTGADITAALSLMPSTTAEEGVDFKWPAGSQPAVVRVGPGNSSSSLTIDVLVPQGFRRERVLDFEIATPSTGSRGWNWRYRLLFVSNPATLPAHASWVWPGGTDIGEGGGPKIGFLRLRTSPSQSAVAGEDLAVEVPLGGTAIYGTHYTTTPPAVDDVVTVRIDRGQGSGTMTITPVAGSLNGNETIILDPTSTTLVDGQAAINLLPLSGQMRGELSRFQEAVGANGYPNDSITPPSQEDFEDQYAWGGMIAWDGEQSCTVYGCNDLINDYRGDTGQLHYEYRSERGDPFVDGRFADWIEVSAEAYAFALTKGVSFLHGCLRVSFSPMFAGYFQADQAGITTADGTVLSGGSPDASPGQVIQPSADGRMFFSSFFSFEDPAEPDASEDVSLALYERFGTHVVDWQETPYSIGDRIYYDFNNIGGDYTCHPTGVPPANFKQLRCLAAHTSVCGTRDPISDLGSNPGLGASGTYWVVEGVAVGQFTGPLVHEAIWTPGADPTVDPPVLVEQTNLGEIGSIYSGDAGADGPYFDWLGNVWWRLWIWMLGEDADTGASLASDPVYNVGNYLNLFVGCSTGYNGGTGSPASTQIGRGCYVAARQFQVLPATETSPSEYQPRETLIYEPRNGVAVDPGGDSIAILNLIDEGALTAGGGDTVLPFEEPTQVVSVSVTVTDGDGSPVNVSEDLEVSLSLDGPGTTEYAGGSVPPVWLPNGLDGSGGVAASLTILSGNATASLSVVVAYSTLIQAALENLSYARLQVNIELDEDVNPDGVVLGSGEASWLFRSPAFGAFYAGSELGELDPEPAP